MKIDTTKKSHQLETQYLKTNAGVARLIMQRSQLHDLAVKTGEYSYIDLAIDFDAAWNRPDLLTDMERQILTDMFVNGVSASKLSAEIGLPEQMIYSIMHSGLEKLRDDLNGYTTEPEPFTLPETVPDVEDGILTDYDTDESDPYPILSKRQLRKRQEREVMTPE